MGGLGPDCEGRGVAGFDGEWLGAVGVSVGVV